MAHRVKLHKLPKAASDYSTLHTASLVEKYLGRFQVPLLNANGGAKYPPGRGDDEFKIMLENEQWKQAIETNGGHSTPLTSQSALVALLRQGNPPTDATRSRRLPERSVLHRDRDRDSAPNLQGHVSLPPSSFAYWFARHSHVADFTVLAPVSTRDRPTSGVSFGNPEDYQGERDKY